VWEFPYYPQYYVPHAALKTGDSAKIEKGEKIEVNGMVVATTLKISVGQRSTTNAVAFEDVKETGKLRGLVKIAFGDMGRCRASPPLAFHMVQEYLI
jgi:hypothetical protein